MCANMYNVHIKSSCPVTPIVIFYKYWYLVFMSAQIFFLVPDPGIYTKRTQPSSILKIKSDDNGSISSLSF